MPDPNLLDDLSEELLLQVIESVLADSPESYTTLSRVDKKRYRLVNDRKAWINLYKRIYTENYQRIFSDKSRHALNNFIAFIEDDNKQEKSILDDEVNDKTKKNLQNLLDYLNATAQKPTDSKRLIPTYIQIWRILNQECHYIKLAICCLLGLDKYLTYLKDTDVEVTIILAKLIDTSFYTPLHIAAISGHTDLVDILLDQAPRLLNSQTKTGETALAYAAMFGNSDFVIKLLSKNAIVTTTNLQKQTAMHLAAKHGHADVIELLAAADKTLIEMQDKSDETAIFSAINSPLATKTLIKLGAQKTILVKGKTKSVLSTYSEQINKEPGIKDALLPDPIAKQKFKQAVRANKFKIFFKENLFRSVCIATGIGLLIYLILFLVSPELNPAFGRLIQNSIKNALTGGMTILGITIILQNYIIPVCTRRYESRETTHFHEASLDYSDQPTTESLPMLKNQVGIINSYQTINHVAGIQILKIQANTQPTMTQSQRQIPVIPDVIVSINNNDDASEINQSQEVIFDPNKNTLQLPNCLR